MNSHKRAKSPLNPVIPYFQNKSGWNCDLPWAFCNLLVTNQLDSIIKYIEKMYSKRKIDSSAYVLNEYLRRYNYFAGEIDLTFYWRYVETFHSVTFLSFVVCLWYSELCWLFQLLVVMICDKPVGLFFACANFSKRELLEYIFFTASNIVLSQTQMWYRSWYLEIFLA